MLYLDSLIPLVDYLEHPHRFDLQGHHWEHQLSAIEQEDGVLALSLHLHLCFLHILSPFPAEDQDGEGMGVDAGFIRVEGHVHTLP